MSEEHSAEDSRAREAAPLADVRPTAPCTKMSVTPAEGDDTGSRALVQAVQRIEAAVSAGFEDMLSEFRTKLAYDASKQAQIDRLHADLQAHRSDLVDKALRPLLLGLVRLHDDLGKVVAAVRALPEAEWTPQRLLAHLTDVQDDVELLLGQQGAQKFETDNEEFDPRRQTVLRTVQADEPARVGRVMARLRPGFETAAGVLQKERVVVYVATAARPEGDKA